MPGAAGDRVGAAGHVLTKLGFQNRSQIAAWTARQGLRTPQAWP
jgi:hypothetical protein